RRRPRQPGLDRRTGSGQGPVLPGFRDLRQGRLCAAEGRAGAVPRRHPRPQEPQHQPGLGRQPEGRGRRRRRQGDAGRDDRALPRRGRGPARQPGTA
nr:hypothetical protein [Tanacetum cinerariifolium]